LHENDAKLIEAYRRKRRQEGKSKDNASCLCRPVIQFSKFLAARSKSLFTAESPDCEDWLKSLTAKGTVDRSKSSKLSLLHVFYEWLITTKGVAFDPTVFSHVPKTWTNEPRSMSKEKLKEILEEARASAKVKGASLLDIRDWAIDELFYGCGARVSEMARLEVDDLSLEQGDVLIHGKGSKDRIPPITDAARVAVDFYLRNARPTLEGRNKGQRDKALFLSQLGRHLSLREMRRIVKKAHPNLSPHILRHSFAQHRADAGERIENIQKDLGHAKLRTTMLYTPKVSFDQLQSEHRRCHPRGRNCAKLLDRRNANPPPGEGRGFDHPSPSRRRSGVRSPFSRGAPMNRIPTTRVEQWIEDFLSTKQSAQTVLQYRPQLYKFLEWLRDRGFTADDQFHTPTVQNIEEYLNELYDGKVPLTMRRQALVAIRSWFKFLGRNGHIKSNPASRIKNQKLTKHLYRPLTEEQVQSTFASIDNKNRDWPARGRAIFEIIYEDALIPKEVCALNVADIDWKRSALSVGGKWLPMEETLVNALRIYLAERDAQLARHKIDPKATPALFISKRAAWTAERRLGPHNLGVILKRIDPRFTPSKLRDACGIHMLKYDADPRIVADLFRTGIDAIDRLLEMSSAKSRTRLMKSHPRATLPQTKGATID